MTCTHIFTLCMKYTIVQTCLGCSFTALPDDTCRGESIFRGAMGACNPEPRVKFKADPVEADIPVKPIGWGRAHDEVQTYRMLFAEALYPGGRRQMSQDLVVAAAVKEQQTLRLDQLSSWDGCRWV